MSNIPREPNAMRIAPRFLQNINNYLAQNSSPAPAVPRIAPSTPSQAIEPALISSTNNNTALTRITNKATADIDLTRLEERSWQHTSEIDRLHDMTANDLRTLQAEIVALRSSHRELQERVDKNEQRVTTIATTNMTFATIMEQQAALLRQTAEAALPGISNNAAFVQRTKAIEAAPAMKAIEAAPASVAQAPVWITTQMPEPPVDTTPEFHGTESPSSEVMITPTADGAPTAATKPLPPHLRAGKKAASPPAPVATPAVTRRSHAIEIKKPETKEVVPQGTVEPANAAVTAPATAQSAATPTIEKLTPPTTGTAIVQSQAVVNMGAPHPVFEPSTESFSWEFLYKALGGTQCSPGFNVVSAFSQSTSLLGSGRTYWLLDAEYEPFAPTRAGEHGAKLTAYFNDDALPGGGDLDNAVDYANVPVFVAAEGGDGYIYMGHYSQTRYSDMLSHSETLRLPSPVLEYWASQLADPKRPDWVTEKLRLWFWPKPVYDGPLPPSEADDTTLTSVAVQTREHKVERALGDYMQELRNWEKDSRIKVSRLIRKETLMALWHNSDLDEEKGLRLWWEYLECVGYDEKFFKNLIAAKKSAGAVGESVRGRTMVKGRPIGGEVEAVGGRGETAVGVEKGKEVLESGGGRPHGSPW
nr:hypothetical protein B0A51_19032 [Rachicladosporium sp. CCFEE 5018]